MSKRDGVSCARIRKQLPLLCGNDESAATARQAWAHLSGCAACRRQWQSFRRARAALAEADADRGVAPVVLPPGFFATLHDDIVGAASALPSIALRRRRRRLAAVSAAAAALVLVGAWLFRPSAAAPADLFTRPAILSTPARGPTGGKIQEISLPLQGLGAQERAVQDLRLLLDDGNRWLNETDELEERALVRRAGCDRQGRER